MCQQFEESCLREDVDVSCRELLQSKCQCASVSEEKMGLHQVDEAVANTVLHDLDYELQI